MDTALTSLAAFAAAAALLTVTPGPDNALMLRTAAAEGPRPAFAAALGISLGCLGWAGLTALGLSALLAASEAAYTVLKWAGAAYLFWLGGRLLLQPRQSFDPGEAGRPGHSGAGGSFLRGLMTNLLNPKVGVFYVSFLPQFIPDGAPVAGWTALLGLVHALVGMAWFICLIAATRPLTQALRRAAVVRWLDRLTGGVFLAFGLRLALESRR
ncbi:MAG: LysE family translocator [Caulobacteraceae bacterium]|nr:LysE family translocator [Caulobacteraceae bacterium]